MKNIIKVLYVSLLTLTLNVSCKKFVNIPPPTQFVTATSVYSSDASAASAVSGLYQSMLTSGVIGGGGNGLSALLGLSADEFDLYPDQYSSTWAAFYTNSDNAVIGASGWIWSSLYNYIYQCNVSIDGIAASAAITPLMKNQLTGELEFCRALSYFYLTNLWSNIPLILTADYKISSVSATDSSGEIYKQMEEDLQDASSKLTYDYKTPAGTVTDERVRPNKAAAQALLARVYLFNKQYQLAEQQADSVINNPSYSLLDDLDQVFLAGSREAIWQLEEPETDLNNTPDGGLFLMNEFGGPNQNSPFILSDSLVSHFETGDLRKTHWIGSMTVDGATYHYPFKYKHGSVSSSPPTEFPTVLRLAEVYLIRAEARAWQNELDGAISDLNAIRERAGLPVTAASTQNSLLDAILKERRFELFTEYGHRWFDLKRTGKIDAVMQIVAPLKGGSWASYKSLFPVPLNDLKLNPNLKQNAGY